jgi:single-stranded-DNA-specific exonuclease
VPQGGSCLPPWRWSIPKREGCPYPNKELAGVGVALKLACAVDGNGKAAAEKYCDVAVGTVADVMLLTGENRGL